MGGGSWDRSSFKSYTETTKRTKVRDDGTYTSSHQDIFKATRLDKALSPKNVTRECRDSAEHPCTVPVILALDVTGSMGQAAVDVATKLNKIMTGLYEKTKDVEFMIMGIGDFYCDSYPLQVSQFESDIRIAEQLDKIFFEFGGGGNDFESYSAAWYFATKHCMLDCWKRGKRGIIITMGDEEYNPYIPKEGRRTSIEDTIGDTLQEDIDSDKLYQEAINKYDIYHINVSHGNRSMCTMHDIEKSWSKILDKQHFKTCTIDEISDVIVDIVSSAANNACTIGFVDSEVAEDAEVKVGEDISLGNGMQVISW